MGVPENVVRDVASAPLSSFHLTNERRGLVLSEQPRESRGGVETQRATPQCPLAGCPASCGARAVPCVAIARAAAFSSCAEGPGACAEETSEFVLPRFVGLRRGAGRSAARACRPRDDLCVCVGALEPAWFVLLACYDTRVRTFAARRFIAS